MFVFNKWLLPLAVLAAVAVAQQQDASHHDLSLAGAETAAADPAPTYGAGKQPANEYRYSTHNRFGSEECLFFSPKLIWIASTTSDNDTL
jgi:hypothetical protein